MTPLGILVLIYEIFQIKSANSSPRLVGKIEKENPCSTEDEINVIVSGNPGDADAPPTPSPQLHCQRINPTQDSSILQASVQPRRTAPHRVAPQPPRSPRLLHCLAISLAVPAMDRRDDGPLAPCGENCIKKCIIIASRWFFFEGEEILPKEPAIRCKVFVFCRERSRGTCWIIHGKFSSAFLTCWPDRQAN